MEELLRKQIRRERKLVRIFLTDGTEIKGNLHLVPDCRLIDLLNSGVPNRPFVAVTEACVELSHGEKISLPFLAINASIIQLCFPIKEEMSNE